MGRRAEGSYTPLFEIPDGFNIPRTGQELTERVSTMSGAMRAMHRMTAEAGDRSELRMVPPAGDIALLPGNLQTPAFAHRIIELWSGPEMAQHGTEIRIGRGIMLLEKGVKQELVMRASSFTHNPMRQLELYGQEVLTGALDYALRVTEEHSDTVSLRVLTKEEKVVAIGSILHTNFREDVSDTAAFAEGGEEAGWHYRVDEESIPEFKSDQQKVLDLALSAEDSRAWLESTLQAYQRM